PSHFTLAPLSLRDFCRNREESFGQGRIARDARDGGGAAAQCDVPRPPRERPRDPRPYRREDAQESHSRADRRRSPRRTDALRPDQGADHLSLHARPRRPARLSLMRLVLASASPRRLDLLGRIGVKPDAVIPADIDESVPRGELPREHARRLAREKAEAVAATQPEALVLAADTVVAVGRRILPKVEDEATLRTCMKLLSGVALAVPGGGVRERLVETMIAMKRLSAEEIDYYTSHGEWRGKAGGYALQGYGEVYVRHIAGSYSN